MTETSLFACVDVDYRDSKAVAACVLFSHWEDATPSQEIVEIIDGVEPYVPGEFYRRELPCILKVLGKLPLAPQVLIIDGYVWLGGKEKPGLGAYLYGALQEKTAIIGVSKNRFRNAAPVAEVFRGQSKRPLFVSTVDIALEEAAKLIQSMAGAHRMPTLLRCVDRLSREAPIPVLLLDAQNTKGSHSSKLNLPQTIGISR